MKKDQLDKLKAAASQNVKERDFWLKQLEGDLINSPFPFDFKNNEKDLGYPCIHTAVCKFEGPLFSNLIRISGGDDQILHIILITGLIVLLHKYTGNLDIILGTPIYKQEIEGEFINTVLALRGRLKPTMSFKDLLVQMRQTMVQANEHQNYPIELLIDRINVASGTGGFPLFDTALLLANIHDKRYLQHIELNMVFSLNRTETYVEGKVEYDSHRYQNITINRIIGHFQNLLTRALSDLNLQIAEIEIISQGEKRQLLVDFNDTQRPYPDNKTIHQLFEEQVEKIPHKVAIIYNDQQLSYSVLNSRCDNLAALLRSEGVTPDTIVGLITERSTEMLIGILSILKAGGAYLPISPQYPEERKRYLLVDSNAHLLLTTSQLGLNRCYKSIKSIFIDKSGGEIKTCLNKTKTRRPLYDDLAYVIYTSGSTGNPKGVLVEHRSVVNILFALHERYALKPDNTCILKTAYTFDVSVTELFGWILGGTRLVLLEPEAEKKPDEIVSAVERFQIGMINFVPSMFTVFLETLSPQSLRRLSSLKYIFLAGEPLNAKTVKSFMSFRAEVILENLYGPTEATVYCTGYSLVNWAGKSSIPIGKPLQNSKLYIFCPTGGVQPIGVPGELFIGGVPLSRGYLNNPEITEEVFIENPHLPGEIIYRTGDFARWLSDGNLEFLGRNDKQVKIRGYRIELGEIEHRLLDNEYISEAAVVARPDETGNRTLCAYIVAKQKLTLSVLWEYLSESLPNYMIPGQIVQLEKMPLTTSGKINRSALPDYRFEDSEAVYEAPANQMEMKLVDIWSRALGMDKSEIGVISSIFRLGGSSLKIMRLIAIINDELGVKLDFNDIFGFPTIKKLASLIEKQKISKYEDITPLPQQEYYEPLCGHPRLYDLCEGNTVYDIRKAFLITGSFNTQVLKKVFDTLIDRHEALRTVFIRVNGELKLKIFEKIDFKIEEKNLVARKDEEKESLAKELLKNEEIPFDLSKGPLFKVRLIQLQENQTIMLFTINHMIVDGWGLEVLLKEMSLLYAAYVENKGNPLAPIDMQYKDVIEWLNRRLRDGKLKRDRNYWMEVLKDHTAGFRLSTDFPRPRKRTVNGANVNFVLERESYDVIKRTNIKFGTTLFITFIAIINVLLRKISGQEDIIIGTNVLQRDHKIFDSQIGWFVNLLILKNKIDGRESLKQFLQKVKKNTLEAYSHKDYPFPKLVEDLKIVPDTSHHPLYDIAVGMEVDDIEPKKQNKQSEYNTLNLSTYPLNDVIYSKYELIIFINVGDELRVTLIYNTDLFKKKTIMNIKDQFLSLIKNLESNLDKEIDEL